MRNTQRFIKSFRICNYRDPIIFGQSLFFGGCKRKTKIMEKVKEMEGNVNNVGTKSPIALTLFIMQRKKAVENKGC